MMTPVSMRTRASQGPLPLHITLVCRQWLRLCYRDGIGTSLTENRRVHTLFHRRPRIALGCWRQGLGGGGRTMRKIGSRRSATAAFALITAALTAASGCTTESTPQGPKVKGKPIKVMTIGTAGPEEGGSTPAMAQVAIAYQGFINHHGGINGRPLSVTFCDDHDNPSGAEQCARQAVSNRDVAVVGWGSISGGSKILSVLSRANNPRIGEGQFRTAPNTHPRPYPTLCPPPHPRLVPPHPPPP